MFKHPKHQQIYWHNQLKCLAVQNITFFKGQWSHRRLQNLFHSFPLRHYAEKRILIGFDTFWNNIFIYFIFFVFNVAFFEVFEPMGRGRRGVHPTENWYLQQTYLQLCFFLSIRIKYGNITYKLPLLCIFFFKRTLKKLNSRRYWGGSKNVLYSLVSRYAKSLGRKQSCNIYICCYFFHISIFQTLSRKPTIWRF